MSNCAVVNVTDNVVVNKIVAEPTDLAPLNTYLVLILSDMECDIGWVWNGTEFVNPNPNTTETVNLNTDITE